MVAAIAGFHSRSDLGLERPRSVSYRIAPATGGCAPHWGGNAPTIRSHEDCKATWRNWQSFHMNTREWADIAYNLGFCQHGYVLAGRGLGVRSAANGTNDGNYRFYAIVWVGGLGMVPTVDALSALEWSVLNARKQGGAGTSVWPHRRFTGSQCPGEELIAHSSKIDGQPIYEGDRPSPPKEDSELMFFPYDTKSPAIEDYQHSLNLFLYLTGGGYDGGGTRHDRNGSHLKVDGHMGPRTADAGWHAITRLGIRLERRSFYVDHRNPSVVFVSYISAENVRMLAAAKAA